MAKLLKHFGIGGSQKKITQPTGGSVQDIPAESINHPDRYCTLTAQDEGTGRRPVRGSGCTLHPLPDSEPLDYATQTLPISGESRRQKSSSVGGALRDWSLRSARSLRYPTQHGSSMKEKVATGGGTGKKNNGGEGLVIQNIMLQRSATTDFVEGSKSYYQQPIQLVDCIHYYY